MPVVLNHSYDGATVWLDLDTANASRRYVLAAGGSTFSFYTSADGVRFVPEGVSGCVQKACRARSTELSELSRPDQSRAARCLCCR